MPCTIHTQQSPGYTRKSFTDSMLSFWRIASFSKNFIGYNFMFLTDKHGNKLAPSHINGGPWLKCFGNNNNMIAQITRSLIGHGLIRDYGYRFLYKKLM